ncbi:LURP-one-related/scramblase family protein [Corynebacterium sp. H113]|uniref:LURP-one-related/scramblase family protein n=1 Tax=Corynebacterium sp. H113 TaxID=3133419 RepID=UPI00309DAB5F
MMTSNPNNPNSYWNNHESYWDTHGAQGHPGTQPQPQQPNYSQPQPQQPYQQYPPQQQPQQPQHGYQQPYQQQPQQPYGGLLSRNMLAIQQIRSFMRDNFDILDENGQVAGYVETQGSRLGRMLMGSRKLTVHETDGRPLFVVIDPVNFVRDTFHVTLPGSDQPMAIIRSRFSLLRRRVDIEIPGYATCQVEGSMWDYSYRFLINGREVAHIERHWAGLMNELLERQKYFVRLAPDVPTDLRMAILGSAIAIDLMKEKDKGDSSAIFDFD